MYAMYASGWRLRGGGASLRFSLKRRLAGCFYLLCALYFPRAISPRRLRLQHKSTRSQAPPTNHLALCLCEAPPTPAKHYSIAPLGAKPNHAHSF
ncbi:hypothetical protein WR25_22274 [Diploscapter pachys]|uniref:Uncharacterized protein n=1 Tax=Diploscapter pachys TaxID=2018661 RepID=A0A2A2L5I8_9BILA|nr:hypothetical protein WR25_22274 [Diploscapter pachys]